MTDCAMMWPTTLGCCKTGNGILGNLQNSDRLQLNRQVEVQSLPEGRLELNMHCGDRTVDVWSSEGPMALTEQMKIMPRRELTTHRPIEEPREHRFSPYEFNGGTSVGIAGKDFAVIAADTRLSSGYSILSRNVSKATKLNDGCVIATGGCRTDVITLHKNVNTRIHQYRLAHDDDITCTAVAQMLSNTLYYRRFFPFYAFNIVAGVDAEGKGAVFTYDAIGSFERTMYAAQGSGQKLIIPVLDNLIGYKNREQEKPELSVEETVRCWLCVIVSVCSQTHHTAMEQVEIVKDSYITAGERNIYTGDQVEIFVITKSGVEKILFDLKKD